MNAELILLAQPRIERDAAAGVVRLHLADRPNRHHDMCVVCVPMLVERVDIRNLLEQFGLRIPDDISVVGFDDIDLSKMASPPLTTVRVYKEELGSVAVRNLRQMLHEKPNCCTTTIIPVRFIKRESVRNLKKPEEHL